MGSIEQLSIEIFGEEVRYIYTGVCDGRCPVSHPTFKFSIKFDQ